MGMAGKADIAPLFTVADALRNALVVRADRPLQWRPAPQGQVADIAEGKLLLTTYPEFWKLTVFFEVEAPLNQVGGSEAAPQRIPRGRREIGYGAGARLERLALDLAMRGVPGGPAYTEAPLTWESVAGSLRMVVPGGELRILGPANGPCMLTHEDGVGIELLGVDTPAELQRHGLVAWDRRRARPLQIVQQGLVHNLRSIDVAGVVGYHALTDNILIALVQVGDELALIHIDGLITRPLARVPWGEALLGEAFDIDRLLREFSGANPGPAAKQSTARPADRGFTFEPVTTANPEPPTGPAANAGPRVDCPPGHTPMSEHHKALCRWYLKRLHRRLKGRGARKARELVLLVLERIELCRHDIVGTRVEVHAELVRILERALSGGDRNIRDCIDRLVEQSLLAEWVEGAGEGRQCRLLFGQLHDPNSALMRRIAEKEAAAEADAAAPALAAGGTTAAPSPDPAPAAPAPTPGGMTAAPSPNPEPAAAPAPTPEPAAAPAPTPGDEPHVATAAAPEEEEATAATIAAQRPDPESSPLAAEAYSVVAEVHSAILATCAGPEPEPMRVPGATSPDRPADAVPSPDDAEPEPPPSPGALRALARGEKSSRVGALFPAPDQPASRELSERKPPPRNVSLQPFFKPSERGDLFDPRFEIAGSPSHLMWDSKKGPQPPRSSDDDQDPP